MTRRAGHESRDAPPWIGLLGMGVIVACVVTALGLVGLLLVAFNAQDPGHAANPPPPSQGPVLETQPGQAIAAVRARIPGETATYGWADPAHDLARIPIDRAMQITAQRGWSDNPAGAKP